MKKLCCILDYILTVKIKQRTGRCFKSACQLTFRSNLHLSLERVLDFLRIDHEPQVSKSGLPPAYWPSGGSLRVENLSARYSEGRHTI